MKFFARTKHLEQVKLDLADRTANNLDSQASRDSADRELDEIIRVSWRVVAVVVLGGVIGGAAGGLDWLWPGFAPFSLLVLVAAAAGLAGLLKRALGKEPAVAAMFFGLCLVVALLLSFHVVQYELFLRQMGDEITARFAQDMRVIYPVELPRLIDEILIRRTGTTGLVGFNLMRYQQIGRVYPALWAARAGLSLVAALLVVSKDLSHR